MDSISSFLVGTSSEGVANYLYIVLFVASIVGGFVGSMSGGAGMITMPLLLLTGINPLQALATNKLQACIGSLTSATQYRKSGLKSMQKMPLILSIAFIFSALGTISVQYIKIEILSRIIPLVMIAIGLYFLLSKKISDEDRRSSSAFIFYLGLIISSFYGGLFGIGVGSFVLALLVSVGGYNLSSALGHSRWIVFGVNVAAMIFFTMGDNILWILGILMCVGQSIGASFGVKMAIKHGAKIIRPIVVSLCFIISFKLILDEFL